jgi:glucosamine--fructose-6-phosphate aminotransferase (isomerizing)
MCGIVGVASTRNSVDLLLGGIKKLEYRGYDSAGMAYIAGGKLARLRSTGRVAELEALAHRKKVVALTGLAHTRWATHGVPSEANAHPHFSVRGGVEVGIVHNGIVENHDVLRARMKAKGYVFTSATDTEVMVHHVHSLVAAGQTLFDAVQKASRQWDGAYAVGFVSSREPNVVVGARKGSPLLVGLGENGQHENFLASDASALLSRTRNMLYLNEGDLVEVRPQGVTIVDGNGKKVKRAVTRSQLSADATDLGRYRHYMQKEIFEQPGALANTLEMVMSARSLHPNLFGAHAEKIFNKNNHLLILACGTSYHAGVVARYWIESIAGIPVTVEIASEYRYRDPVATKNTLVVTISQSGETADTLAALKHAQSLGMTDTLTICNVPESALIRQSKLRFLTRAGPEIGVASTKAFTTQLAALFVLALVLAKQRKRVNGRQETRLLASLRHLPRAMESVLSVEPRIAQWAKRLKDKDHALFLGRGLHFPIAMEGALKLKEISYIHAEAYAAGELKHGPLALVDRHMPVIAVAPNDQLLDKLKSNLQEVGARGGELFVFADRGANVREGKRLHAVELTDHAGALSPILHVIPLQLLAYHVALLRGTDVDKPRNLAKSVTVE